MSAFFWGYFITQIPAGVISDVIGGKTVITVGVFGSCITTMITPFMAKIHWYLFIAIRVLLGVFQVNHFSF